MVLCDSPAIACLDRESLRHSAECLLLLLLTERWEPEGWCGRTGREDFRRTRRCCAACAACTAIGVGLCCCCDWASREALMCTSFFGKWDWSIRLLFD